MHSYIISHILAACIRAAASKVDVHSTRVPVYATATVLLFTQVRFYLIALIQSGQRHYWSPLHTSQQ